MGDLSSGLSQSLTSKDKVTFKEVFEEELPGHYSDALARMSSNELSGLIVRQFLSSDEVGVLIDQFKAISDSDKTITPSGSFFPEVFPEFNRRVVKGGANYELLAKEFFLKNHEYAMTFKEKFVVDLFYKICNTLEKMSSGLSVNPPKGIFGDGAYPFGSFRCFPPETGTLPVHCGNYFQTLFNDVYDDLNSQAVVLDQLSYFVTLQSSDVGGELEVLGINWATGMTKSDMMNDDEVILPNGKVLHLSDNTEFSTVKYKPKPGDLLVFQGGSIWHRVSRVHGNKERITFGGFIAPSKSGESYLIWS